MEYLYLYDICGIGVRVSSTVELENVLPGPFRRDALERVDIDIAARTGMDAISPDGIDWFEDNGPCRAFRPDGGSGVYEYVRSITEEPRQVLCRFRCSPDYSSALVTCDDERVLGRFLVLAAQLIYRRYLIVRGGLVMHGVSIRDGDRAIIFSGPSGMGKSTQADLWVKHRGAQIINGDKSSLIWRDGLLSTTGSPWSGTSRIFTDLAAPIGSVVFLEQAREDTAVRLSGVEALNHLIPRSYLPYYSKELMDTAFRNMERIVSGLRFFLLRNTATERSVDVLKEAIEQSR